MVGENKRPLPEIINRPKPVGACLVTSLSLLSFSLALWLASPAARATAGEEMIGTSCSTGQSNLDWDTVGQCNGTTFAHGPLILGAMTNPPYSATTCTSSNAGMIQWTGSVFQGCNGSGWGNLLLGGGSTLNGITAATGSNTIDSGANAQVWEWGTLSTGTAMSFTTSSMTGGTLLSLQDTAAASTSTGYVLSVTDATTGTGYGVYSAMTATANTGYAGYFTNSSTAAGYGVYGSITGAANTGYAGYFTNTSGGGFGIYALGTTTTGNILTYSGVPGSGAAIYAKESNVNNTAPAIYAENDGNGGYAIEALGNSTTGITMYVDSNNGTAIYAQSNNNTSGNSAVYAYTSGAAGQTYGVQAQDYSSGGYALYGLNNATTGSAYGVWGGTDSTAAGVGVYGVERGTANTGYGGYFSNTSTSGWSLYAGTAPSYFAGSVGIGTTSPQAALDVNGAARVGSTAASCAAGNAGAVQYTSGTLEACNGTSWIPIDGGMHFISTQTASSSASLQFTNLATSYNTLFLECNQLVLSANGDAIVLKYGEGATPTWEAAHYDWLESALNDQGGTADYENTSDSSIRLTYPSDPGNSAGYSVTLNGYIYNIGSSSLYKTAQITTNYFNTGRHFQEWTTSGTYTGDTNAITGIEIVPGSGTISSGTCSLYGMN
jgi:hypothetical protein